MLSWNFGDGRVLVLGEERVGGQQLARDAEPALHGPLVQETPWIGAKAPIRRQWPRTVGEPRPVDLDREDEAGIDGPTVDDDGAGAALANQGHIPWCR